MTSIQSTRILALCCVTFAIVATASCGGGDATGSTCPQNSALTYDTFGRNFFASNCLRCHSSKSKNQSPQFDTVEQIRQHASTIDREAAAGPKVVNDDMPDDGDISEAERRKLGEWLACGAP